MAEYLGRVLAAEDAATTTTTVAVLDIDGTLCDLSKGRALAELAAEACDETHYVTARRKDMRRDTVAWIEARVAAGVLPPCSGLHMRALDAQVTSADYKYAQRLAITASSKRIRVNLGDQWSDMASIRGLGILREDLVAEGLARGRAASAADRTRWIAGLYGDILEALRAQDCFLVHGYDPTTDYSVKLPTNTFVP